MSQSRLRILATAIPVLLVLVFSPALAGKTEIVVANKMDLTDSDEALERFREALDVDVVAISAVTGRGLEQLTERIWRTIQELPPDQPAPEAEK